MPETFSYKIQKGSQSEHEPDVAVVKLGDGYEQRQIKGINPLLSSYSVTVIGIDGIPGKSNIARDADAFMRRQMAVHAFHWVTPDTNEELLFVCRKWSLSKTYPVITFTATFEQVPR